MKNTTVRKYKSMKKNIYKATVFAVLCIRVTLNNHEIQIITSNNVIL